MSNEYTKDHIFNETSPNFRLRFMWMAGNLNDEEFDKLAAKMTLKDVNRTFKCPHIMFHGEFDHLTHTRQSTVISTPWDQRSRSCGSTKTSTMGLAVL